MTTDQTFVIVGASLTGAKAAEELRTEGFDVPLDALSPVEQWSTS